MDPCGLGNDPMPPFNEMNVLFQNCWRLLFQMHRSLVELKQFNANNRKFLDQAMQLSVLRWQNTAWREQGSKQWSPENLKFNRYGRGLRAIIIGAGLLYIALFLN